MNQLPMPLRSRLALGEPFAGPAALPLTAGGSTYTMAQEAVFVDTGHYAVGRWDGTLSLFAFTDSTTQGPLIAKAVNSPAQEGIQMIVPLGAGVFDSSNDDGSLLVWSSACGDWTDLTLATTLSYPDTLGVANSGAVVTSNGMPTFVAGHANGYLSIWRQGGAPTGWTLAQTVDVRAANPVNPWGLHNVRGVVPLALGDDAGYVATGSEDGNLTIVRASDGKILSATVYNPAAQRGINSVAVSGNLVLVANCAVGTTDSNLWCYSVDQTGWSIANTGKAALKVDPNAAQVFNFDVIFSVLDCGPMQFFCSTEEGALWMGEVQPGGNLSILGYQTVGTAALGSALCSSRTRLAVTAYDLHEYMIGA